MGHGLRLSCQRATVVGIPLHPSVPSTHSILSIQLPKEMVVVTLTLSFVERKPAACSFLWSYNIPGIVHVEEMTAA